MKTLRILRKNKGLSMKELGEIIGVAESTISQYETGKREPDFETLLKLGEFFNVSVDYLLRGDSLSEGKAPTLNKKDERDIARMLEETLNLLESSDALMFDGEPLDQDSMDLLKTSLQNQYTLAKKIAKQKFTPKKYRTDNEK